MKPESPAHAGLVEILDRILDKGIVINADIAVAVAGTELLGIKVRAALASFETAARYGLQFPSGTNLQLPVWEEAQQARAACPQCARLTARAELEEQGCRWCGYTPWKLAATNPVRLPTPARS